MKYCRLNCLNCVRLSETNSFSGLWLTFIHRSPRGSQKPKITLHRKNGCKKHKKVVQLRNMLSTRVHIEKVELVTKSECQLKWQCHESRTKCKQQRHAARCRCKLALLMTTCTESKTSMIVEAASSHTDTSHLFHSDGAWFTFCMAPCYVPPVSMDGTWINKIMTLAVVLPDTETPKHRSRCFLFPRHLAHFTRMEFPGKIAFCLFFLCFSDVVVYENIAYRFWTMSCAGKHLVAMGRAPTSW